MPKVSVIIPNYNHEGFLIERLRSVFGQVYSDFDVIILDDFSNDRSREIIKAYESNPKVSNIVFNDQNSGSTFEQWKKGILLAKGDWIWIAESDDVADLNFLNKLLLLASRDPKTVICFSASNLIDRDGNVIRREDWAQDISDRDWGLDFCNLGVDEIKEQMFFKNVIPNASAVIFKKDAVNLSVFDNIKTMKFAGDWFFWIKLMEVGKICYTSQTLNSFRYHSETTRSTKSAELEKKRFSEYFDILRYLKGQYKLSWNWKKHVWILDEWLLKYKSLSRSIFGFYNRQFPLFYNIVLALKIVKSKFNNIR